MEIYLKNKWNYQTVMLDRYASTYTLLQVYIAINAILFTTTLCLRPILMKNQALPIHGSYPFSTESRTIVVLLYIQHVIVAISTLLNNALDFIATTLIWSLAARFELLQCDFQQMSSGIQLKFNICKHQRLIR